jgi:hypothetical protein
MKKINHHLKNNDYKMVIENFQLSQGQAIEKH